MEIQGLEELKSTADKDDYDSEEEGASFTSSDCSSVPDEHVSSHKVGKMKMENSRTSISNISTDLLNQACEYDPDDLVHRESIMIFSSVITPKPLTLDDFEIIDFLGQGTFGKVYLTKLKSSGKFYAIKAISRQVSAIL